MGIFFKVLARKHAVSMYFGSLLREPIDQVVARQPTHFLVIFLPATTKKLRIVALLHGDNPQLFLFTFLLVTRMSCGSSPWGTATTFNFFYRHFFWWQRWAAGRCREARRRPSTFFIDISSGDKDELRVVAVRHGDDPQLFISTFLLETRISCGSSPWGTATTLNFLVLKKCSPQLGIEPRTSLRQAEVLNNRLPRNHFNTVIMNVTIHKTGKLHVS